MTHYYLFDNSDSSGNILNYVSNKYDLIFLRRPEYPNSQTSIRSDTVNNSLTINNSLNVIKTLYSYNGGGAIIDKVNITNQGLTIACWYKETSSNQQTCLFNFFDFRCEFGFCPGVNKLRHNMSTYPLSISVQSNSWNHIVFTLTYSPIVSQSVLIVYVNGQIALINFYTYPVIGSYKSLIGNTHTNNNSLSITDFRIYNRVLKINEIRSLFNDNNQYNRTIPIIKSILLDITRVIVDYSILLTLNLNSHKLLISNNTFNSGIHNISSSSTSYGNPVDIFSINISGDNIIVYNWKAGCKGSPSTYTQDSFDGNSPSKYIGGGSDAVKYSTKVGDTYIFGEWIQIELSYQINLISYELFSNLTLWSINKFYIVGSNDNNSWNQLDYINFDNKLPTSSLLIYNINSYGYYSSIRLIVTELMNNMSQFSLIKIYLTGSPNISMKNPNIQPISSESLIKYYDFIDISGTRIKNNVTNTYDLELFNGARILYGNNLNNIGYGPIYFDYNTKVLGLIIEPWINTNFPYGFFNNLNISNNGLTIAFVTAKNNRQNFDNISRPFFDLGNDTSNNNIVLMYNKDNLELTLTINNQVSKKFNIPNYLRNRIRHITWVMTPPVQKYSSNLPIQTSTSYIYINGINMATFTDWIYPDTTVQRTHNYIGRSRNTTNTYNGIISDFRIYNRVLTEKEILYLALKLRYSEF
jgi:hypothetical protein